FDNGQEALVRNAGRDALARVTADTEPTGKGGPRTPSSRVRPSVPASAGRQPSTNALPGGRGWSIVTVVAATPVRRLPPVSATPPSLLHRLSEAPQDADAWRRFDDIYRPLLGGWLRRYALQDHDADDLVQDVLRAVAGELPHFHYDPARRHFRGWL